MTIPSLDTILSYLTIVAAVLGALLAALWLSLIIWAFRDMRARSRDPFAQILAALLVAALPIVGIVIYFILRPPETLAEAYERALEEEALLQEIEEKPRCPGCSRVIEPTWLLCPWNYSGTCVRSAATSTLTRIKWRCPRKRPFPPTANQPWNRKQKETAVSFPSMRYERKRSYERCTATRI